MSVQSSISSISSSAAGMYPESIYPLIQKKPAGDTAKTASQTVQTTGE